MVKVTIPNVKQPITDESGYITKAHYDFLRRLWERTGGNQDFITIIQDEVDDSELLIFRSKFKDLERRIRDLERQLDSLGC